MNKVTVKFLFAWYDLWVGVFIDRAKWAVYVFPIPTLGICIGLLPDGYSIERVKYNSEPYKWILRRGEVPAYPGAMFKTWGEARRAAFKHAHTLVQLFGT